MRRRRRTPAPRNPGRRLRIPQFARNPPAGAAQIAVGSLYEFHYPQGSKVLGVGFARRATCHPPARAPGYGARWRSASRKAGFLRDFVRQGFNRTNRPQGIRRRAVAHRRIGGVFRTPTSASPRAPIRSTRITCTRRTPFLLRRAAHRPGNGPQRCAAARRRLRSALDGRQYLDRVLAEGRFAAAHRSPGPHGRGPALERPRYLIAGTQHGGARA